MSTRDAVWRRVSRAGSERGTMYRLLRKFGLKFSDPADEQAFYEAFLTRRLRFSRLMLVFAAVLLTFFITWDQIIDPVGARITMWIRIGVVAPACIGCAAILRYAWARRYFEPLIVATGSLTTISLSIICAILDGGYNLVASGLLLILLFVASLFRVRTPAYLVFALLTLAGYFVGLIWADGYAPRMSAMNILMITNALTVSTMSVISRELGARSEFRAQQEVGRSHARIEELLHSMLPAAIVRRIQDGETLIADQHDEVSIVFSDLVGFTQLSRRMDAPRLVAVLNQLFSAFDKAAAEHGMHKIKTIGDAYMAVGGVIDADGANSPAENAADFAFAMVRATRELSVALDIALDVRVGLHVGPVVAGVIGTSRPAFDCWGESVNLASRLESNATPGAVLISENAWRLLRDRHVTEVREAVDLKGIGRTRVYLLRPPVEAHGLPRAAAIH